MISMIQIVHEYRSHCIHTYVCTYVYPNVILVTEGEDISTTS